VDRADRRIKTVESLEEEFGLPILATIPRIGRRWIPQRSSQSGTPVGFTGSRSQLGESFRALRSSLKYFQLDHPIRTILVTSGLPQEGKTITTVNLAISLALSGARVVVIEADLRRPMIPHYLNLDNKVGLSHILTGASAFGDGLQLVKITDFSVSSGHETDDSSHRPRLERNFYCVTAGPLPPNPAELLGSERMVTLLEEAAANADYVLVDTPPILLVADALGLMGAVDAVIVSARVRSTTIEEAHDVRSLLERSGARTLGLVAGGVRAGARSYYRKYGYGYYASDH
jgi:polysaccharide biosynthesis transport protein